MGEHACVESIMLILILYEIYGNVFFRIIHMYIYMYLYEYSYIHVYYISLLILYMDKVYNMYICYKDSYK